MTAIRSIAHPDRKARALAVTICAIWANWNDGQEDACDDALALAFEQAAQLDWSQVNPDVATPLDYFTKAYRAEINPQDRTYCEMVQAIAEGLALASLRG